MGTGIEAHAGKHPAELAAYAATNQLGKSHGEPKVALGACCAGGPRTRCRLRLEQQLLVVEQYAEHVEQHLVVGQHDVLIWRRHLQRTSTTPASTPSRALPPRQPDSPPASRPRAPSTSARSRPRPPAAALVPRPSRRVRTRPTRRSPLSRALRSNKLSQDLRGLPCRPRSRGGRYRYAAPVAPRA